MEYTVNPLPHFTNKERQLMITPKKGFEKWGKNLQSKEKYTSLIKNNYWLTFENGIMGYKRLVLKNPTGERFTFSFTPTDKFEELILKRFWMLQHHFPKNIIIEYILPALLFTKGYISILMTEVGQKQKGLVLQQEEKEVNFFL